MGITSDIISKVIELIVLVITILIGKYIVPWLKGKIDKDKMLEVVMWAETFVKAAEMLLKGEKMGHEKLDQVTTCLRNKLTELGITMTDEQIRAVIENAVYNIKQEQNK